MRCFDQKRRFGADLLYPVERYTSALTETQVKNRAGVLVPNPLFAARDGLGPRSPTLVSVSLIVGAPWQDLATTDSLSAGSTLQYLDGAGLAANRRWPLLLGDPAHGVLPSDSFMIESVTPRTGQNPLTNSIITEATSLNPQANPINGHEQNTPRLDDLQYACIFRFQTPVVCAPGSLCECAADSSGSTANLIAINSPVCQPPAGGIATTTQYYGKAYPGIRELRFAQALGDRAVAGSICPKSQSNPASAESGYGPALGALVSRIKKTLR